MTSASKWFYADKWGGVGTQGATGGRGEGRKKRSSRHAEGRGNGSRHRRRGTWNRHSVAGSPSEHVGHSVREVARQLGGGFLDAPDIREACRNQTRATLAQQTPRRGSKRGRTPLVSDANGDSRGGPSDAESRGSLTSGYTRVERPTESRSDSDSRTHRRGGRRNTRRTSGESNRSAEQQAEARESAADTRGMKGSTAPSKSKTMVLGSSRDRAEPDRHRPGSSGDRIWNKEDRGREDNKGKEEKGKMERPRAITGVGSVRSKCAPPAPPRIVVQAVDPTDTRGPKKCESTRDFRDAPAPRAEARVGQLQCVSKTRKMEGEKSDEKGEGGRGLFSAAFYKSAPTKTGEGKLPATPPKCGDKEVERTGPNKGGGGEVGGASALQLTSKAAFPGFIGRHDQISDKKGPHSVS